MVVIYISSIALGGSQVAIKQKAGDQLYMFKGKTKGKATTVEAASYNMTTNNTLLPLLGELPGDGSHVDGTRRWL